MSGFGRLACRVRTVRHLRAEQLIAQAVHAFARPIDPAKLGTEPPDLALAPEAIRRLLPFLAAPRLDRVEETEESFHAPGVSTGVVFEFVNRRVSFAAQIDWNHAAEGPLWAYHLHQFDFLRGTDVSPALRVGLMLDWIERHPRGIGWDPHPTSHRILAWGRLLLTDGALDLDETGHACVRSSLADQIETLSRNVETRLQGNHLFTNLAAIVFGGLLFSGARADAWLRFAPAFEAELRRQVLPDGTHEERSPMYHCLLFEQVLDLVNLTRVTSARAPLGLLEALEDTAVRMRGALDVLTHADGEIALFADSGFGSAPSPEELSRQADALGLRASSPTQPGFLEDSGYVKLAAGRFSLIASVAGPGPAHQPGHAHCDALAFELLVGAERVVTDTGVFEYRPGALRDASRATASHATAQVARSEQAEVWAAHRIGGRPRVEVASFVPSRSIEATCASFGTRDTVHRRRFSFDEEQLLIDDRLEGRGRFVAFALPLAPEVGAEFMVGREPSRTLLLTLAAGGTVEVELPAPDVLAWRLERTPYFPEFGRSVERWCLVGTGDDFRSGRWVFRVRA